KRKGRGLAAAPFPFPVACANRLLGRSFLGDFRGSGVGRGVGFGSSFVGSRVDRIGGGVHVGFRVGHRRISGFLGGVFGLLRAGGEGQAGGRSGNEKNLAHVFVSLNSEFGCASRDYPPPRETPQG